MTTPDPTTAEGWAYLRSVLPYGSVLIVPRIRDAIHVALDQIDSLTAERDAQAKRIAELEWELRLWEVAAGRHTADEVLAKQRADDIAQARRDALREVRPWLEDCLGWYREAAQQHRRPRPGLARVMRI